MALEKTTPVGPFAAPTELHIVLDKVQIHRCEGIATVAARGFQSKAAWETVKTIRTLKAKQEREQREWRARRTEWEASHSKDEPFAEPEPFEQIPSMPPFQQFETVTLEYDDYLSLEVAIAKGNNAFALGYGALKNPELCPQFEGAKDA